MIKVFGPKYFKCIKTQQSKKKKTRAVNSKRKFRDYCEIYREIQDLSNSQV